MNGCILLAFNLLLDKSQVKVKNLRYLSKLAAQMIVRFKLRPKIDKKIKNLIIKINNQLKTSKFKD
jgi:hypothetical protein